MTCAAWRLEPEVGGVVGYDAAALAKPHAGPGHVTIDGEDVPYGPAQAEVHPGLLRVYAGPQRAGQPPTLATAEAVRKAERG